MLLLVKYYQTISFYYVYFIFILLETSFVPNPIEPIATLSGRKFSRGCILKLFFWVKKNYSKMVYYLVILKITGVKTRLFQKMSKL